MPAEQRTPEIQRALYHWIERKDFNTMTAEDQAVLSEPRASRRAVRSSAIPMNRCGPQTQNAATRRSHVGTELLNDQNGPSFRPDEVSAAWRG